MKNITGSRQVIIIVAVFIVSRMLAIGIGLRMDSWALSAYWQYLDLETLKHHLLTGVWYDHAQPPVFNLFLGSVLKIGAGQSIVIFAIILRLITLANALFLFAILKKLNLAGFLPLIVALLYILSPATLVLECELFYTSSVSLLLLVSVYFLIRLKESNSHWNAYGFIFSLALLCLTRSIYHILWLFLIAAFMIYYFRKAVVLNYLILASLLGIILVGSWYMKNKILFGKFTSSTWIGMNLARNVFHDNEIKDSGRIEAYLPFSKISVYRKFLDPEYEGQFRELNNRDLLQEMKNDSFINLTEVSYIPVSDLYQKASLEHIGNHPVAYAKNVVQSSILYFTPATVYSLNLKLAEKIKYYDLLYSFNLKYFAYGKLQGRILLTISAIPKIILYLFVFFVFIRYWIRTRSISPWNLFIVITIGYVFGISSLFEHFENMRFRFETEPLFLIVAAQVFSWLYARSKKLKAESIKQNAINN